MVFRVRLDGPFVTVSLACQLPTLARARQMGGRRAENGARTALSFTWKVDPKIDSEQTPTSSNSVGEDCERHTAIAHWSPAF